MSCGTGVRYDKITAYYLLDHPDLAWVSTNSSEMLKVPNAIILNGTSGLLWPFMFGRTFFNGQWTLGKVHVGNNAFLLNFWGNNTEQRYFDNFQVLTCTPQTNGQTTTPREPTRSTTTVATTQTPKPCGTFVPYDTTNGRTDPDNYGFLGGIDYKDLSYQYVGYGNNNYGPACANQNPCPGYINTNSSSPGVYMSCANGLHRDSVTAYYLLGAILNNFYYKILLNFYF
jgi:hypothetical protein